MTAANITFISLHHLITGMSLLFLNRHVKQWHNFNQSLYARKHYGVHKLSLKFPKDGCSTDSRNVTKHVQCIKRGNGENHCLGLTVNNVNQLLLKQKDASAIRYRLFSNTLHAYDKMTQGYVLDATVHRNNQPDKCRNKRNRKISLKAWLQYLKAAKHSKLVHHIH